MDNYLIPIIPFHKQIISRGAGSHVFDENGKKYLDLNCGQFCTILGHSNPELADCVYKISKTLTHTSSGIVSDIVIKNAAKLNEISGELDARSILLSTGAEAVEFAIRYAKHITQRSGLVCFEKGYHGLTLGTQSITYGGKYAFPNITNVFSVRIPRQDDDVEECLEELERVVERNRGNLAAVIMEPIVSVGGMIYPSKQYFDEVRIICNKNEVLLIFDESQTGFGRTGSWFCYQELNVIPDMVICSKGIGMGYPISAVLFNNKLSSKKITMTHYSSHQNDPFAAGIVSFGIDYITRHKLLDSNKKKGENFLAGLFKVCSKNNLFRNPRGHGLMLGMDFYIEGISDYRAIYAKVYDQAAESQVLLQGTDGGRVLRFLPDYLISQNDIDFCMEVLSGVRI